MSNAAFKRRPSRLSVSHDEEMLSPVALCDAVLDYPGAWFGGFLAGHAFWAVLVLALLVSGYDVIPFSSDVPLYLRDHITYEREDAVIAGEDTADFSLTPPEEQLERSIEHVTLEFIWVAKDRKSNIFQPEQLQHIYAAESEALSFSAWADFCRLTSLNTSDTSLPRECTRPYSAPFFTNSSFFLPPPATGQSLLFDPVASVTPNLTQAAVDRTAEFWSNWTLEYAATLGDFAPIWAVTDAQFGSPPGFGESVALRTELSFGLPLPGYAGDVDRKDDQLEKLLDEMFDAYDSWGEDNSGAGMDLYYSDSEGGMVSRKALEFLVISFVLIMGSILFVWNYTSIMTGSYFIGSFGLLQILFVFFPSVFLYRYVFNQKYFGTFNVLSLYIVIGIGVDDVFVFMDHHELSGSDHVPAAVSADSYTRLSWTYRKAGKAMLVTSLTTCFSFLANSTSSFPAIYTFGIFSALLVASNYVSVITFFTAVVGFYHTHFETTRICCADKCCPCCVESGDNSKGRVEQGSNSGSGKGHADHGGSKEGPWLQRFFRDTWADYVVTHRIGKWVVIGVTAALTIFFIVYAVQLEPDPETPELLPSSSPYASFSDIKAKFFGARVGDPLLVSAFVTAGIRGISRDGTNPTDADDRGVVEFDPAFQNLGSVEDQLFVESLCDALADSSGGNPRRIIPPGTNGRRSLECFMHGIRDWYNDAPESPKLDPSFRFPINASHCASLPSPHSDSDVDCFNWVLQEFITDPTTRAYDSASQTNYEHWEPYMFAERDPTQTAILRFVKLEIATTISFSTEYNEGIDLYTVWEDWMKEQLARPDIPDKFKSMFQYTPSAWHYFFLQEVLIQEAFTGIGVALLLAFIVLIFATQNLIIGALATACIALIVLGVMAAIVLFGWKLGILESINVVLVPGLAVDYVVHLADAVRESHEHRRERKVKEALGEVGVSIVSGAMSTLGSTFFMFFAPILFFFKFAVFIFTTIFLSMFVALGFFSAMLATIGPEGEPGLERGSIKPWLDACGMGVHNLFVMLHLKPEDDAPDQPDPTSRKRRQTKVVPEAIGSAEVEMQGADNSE